PADASPGCASHGTGDGAGALTQNTATRDELFGGRLAIAQAVAGSVALVVVATIALGIPRWLESTLVARPIAEDADAAGVPYAVGAALAIALGFGAALGFAAAAGFIGWRKHRIRLAAVVAMAVLLRVP